ncbi:MAG: UvrD-helicase domain-containing protein [Lachnospiraceae bacterium]|nr:UvrD-helicase domain-containing protein [uncultured Acetatifactor sp.]MCI8286435.1 UvrD-helicase domain-containing protein [Lachnospiraceae bacterium]
MAVTFTPEQREAIELHGCNILVSAAAGSGKTAVLVERIVRMVCDETKPVDIDRLLIVTFTNAAAAEMRERIAAGISARLSECPDSEHIQRQATLLHNAQITTIDSFCLFLLRNHFNEIGLDPAFRIADEGEIRLMQQEALQELIEDSYVSGGEAFRFCVEYFCPGGKERVLEQHILNLSRYASSFPWPAAWLEARKGDYAGSTAEEMNESTYALWLREHLRRMIAGCAEKLEKVRALCQEPDGPWQYGELVDRELEQVQGLLRCHSLEEYAVKLEAVNFGRLPSKKDASVSVVKRDLAREMRAQVKESLQGLRERFFATNLELAVRQSAACGGPVNTLLDLVLDFERRMAEKKQEKRVVDFSDVEHFALDILLDRQGEEAKSSAVAREYRQHFEEILTDEYQDSNLVQEYLLRAVSGEEEGRFNRFMVGDVKQSIYRFRLARPELFLEKYNTYTVSEGPCRRIDLAKNFRSRVQVVDAVNEVFGRLMSEEAGGVAYDERAALYPGAVYPDSGDCAGELLLAEKPGRDGKADAKQTEAMVIARKIRELKGSFQVMDRGNGESRPVRYSDMVILLRTNSGWDEPFRETLEKEGIPVYITSTTGYFDAVEVQELLQLLRVLDNPCQDIPLFGVMRSIFGGFTEEEIAAVRSHAKGCSLYEALKRYSIVYGRYGQSEEAGAESGQEAVNSGRAPAETERGTAQEACADEAETGQENAVDRVKTEQDSEPDKAVTPLGKKAAAFLRRIAEYREYTVYLPVRELLTRLINDFGYLDYVTALPAGSRRRANVEMLLTRASDFEKTSYFGLFHFIRYMEQLEKYDIDSGGAELLDENADVVRIMSIHKSKGLEFPVTFVAGLSKRFNMQDANQSLILDMDLGLGTDYADPERRIRNKTLRRTVLSRKLREDSLAEELRLLYVAMTRAREKLILTGVLENAAEKWEKYRELGGGMLTSLDFMEAGSFLDFLLPVLPGSSIQVSVTEELEEAAEEITEQVQYFHRRDRLEQAESLGDTEAQKRLTERLNAVYPYAELSDLYTKTTVSELKIAAMADRDEAAYHTFEAKEVQPYIPLFRREEEAVSGTIRGNAYHRVMEILDFGEVLWSAVGRTGGFPGDYGEYRQRLQGKALAAAISAFLQREAESGRLAGEYLQAVRLRKLEEFLCSPLAFRMWQAQRGGGLYREQPFVLGIDARRLKSSFPEEETVLIQGIIDVFFEEEDGVVLLDYKTDSVGTLRELWNRYETQLDYYQEAIEKIFGKKVKECILYSFHLGKY